jgi:RNA polymerase sigma-70 factor
VRAAGDLTEAECGTASGAAANSRERQPLGAIARDWEIMEPLDHFLSAHAATIERLYSSSGGTKWNVTRSEFASALWRACERRFAGGALPLDQAAIESFLGSLHGADLALALACSAGNQDAWRFFQSSYRTIAENIARALVRDKVRARELVDSLWADLFGLRGNPRRSPLDHYHGRSPLGAWLRAVIAQREANAWRVERRHESLDEMLAPASVDGVDPEESDRRRYLAILSGVLTSVLADLAPKDKMRLSFYYLHGLTLGEVGELTAEHESTVSRNLMRTRIAIRRQVERVLRREHRLSEDQIGRCFEYASGEWPFDLGSALAQEK